MMYDFERVFATTKDEQVRAWAIEQAIDSDNMGLTDDALIKRAERIEKFVKDGNTRIAGD